MSDKFYNNEVMDRAVEKALDAAYRPGTTKIVPINRESFKYMWRKHMTAAISEVAADFARTGATLALLDAADAFEHNGDMTVAEKLRRMAETVTE